MSGYQIIKRATPNPDKRTELMTAKVLDGPLVELRVPKSERDSASSGR